jgi:hypothetical protein
LRFCTQLKSLALNLSPITALQADPAPDPGNGINDQPQALIVIFFLGNG